MEGTTFVVGVGTEDGHRITEAQRRTEGLGILVDECLSTGTLRRLYGGRAAQVLSCVITGDVDLERGTKVRGCD